MKTEKELKKRWINEIARDIMALGGIPFLLLVIARVSFLGQNYYPFQFIFGAVIFLLLMIIFKANLHSGIGFIILIFTIFYYNSLTFTIFASLVYIGLIMSLIYFKKDKKELFKGVLFGIISSVLSYYLIKLIFDRL